MRVRPSRRVPRLLRTLWHLRREQLAGQLAHRLRGAGRPVPWRGPAPELAVRAPAVPFLGPPAHCASDGWSRVRVAGREVRFAEGIDWDFAGEGPLWAYHLHYFDWARDPALSPEARRRAMLDWIRRHREGVGWHAGPLSLRSFAWGKLLATPGALPEDPEARRGILASWADQLATLSARLERHLLANHYLWNLLALAFAGVLLEGRAADAALAHEGGLRRELDEQIGPDGAHFERSPTYHALLLENVLDLANAMRARPGRAPAALERTVEDAAARMAGALVVWTHPDGEIALFGDSAFGVAAPPAAIQRYAQALGLAARPPERPGLLDAAGFVRLEEGPWSLLASVAGPSPAYQPGHAHCDALSFELCVRGERAVTDTGVAEYIPGPLRDASRATASHATLQVAGAEQAELWGAHRMGGRPAVALVRVEPGKRAEAVCSGWATPEVLHRRAFALEEGGVTIEDTLSGPPAPVRLHLPLAPGLEPQLEGARARVPLSGGGALAIELPEAAEWRVVRRPYFPELGRVEERAALEGRAEGLERVRTRFRIVDG